MIPTRGPVDCDIEVSAAACFVNKGRVNESMESPNCSRELAVCQPISCLNALTRADSDKGRDKVPTALETKSAEY